MLMRSWFAKSNLPHVAMTLVYHRFYNDKRMYYMYQQSTLACVNHTVYESFTHLDYSDDEVSPDWTMAYFDTAMGVTASPPDLSGPPTKSPFQNLETLIYKS